MSQKKALFYVNLGTPKSMKVSDVKTYLREFLMDKYVIDIPWLFRFFLVYFIIIPLRVKKSAHAYSLIWTEKGSPLLFYSQNLVNKIAASLGSDWVVRLGMRYGEPIIRSAIQDFYDLGVKDIRVVLAYPQYAFSSSQTAIDEVEKNIKDIYQGQHVQVSMKPHYETEPQFVSYWAQKIKSAFESKQYDHVLFSYHGLPIKHVKKISSYCQGIGACSLQRNEKNKLCYRQQCYQSTAAIAQLAGLDKAKYSVGFQSRLSSGWIRPFSDEFYRELPKKGAKRLLVLSPSFTIDCLETLEEVSMRGREEFIQNGGLELDSIACLNDSDEHVKLVTQLAIS
jgi:ferrochelatase